MTFIPNTEYLLEASKGNIAGTSFYRWPMVNSTVGTSFETTWDNGGRYAFPTSGTFMSIASTSTADNSSGTGARSVKVDFLDSSHGTVSETLTLNGTFPVSTASSDVFRVNTLTVLTAGSSTCNLGKIALGTGSFSGGVPATTYSVIISGEGASAVGVFTIPAGQTGFFQRMVISSDGNKSVQARLGQTIAGVRYIVGTSKFGDGLNVIALDDFGSAAATSDLEWIQKVDSGTAQIDVYAVLLLVDN